MNCFFVKLKVALALKLELKKSKHLMSMNEIMSTTSSGGGVSVSGVSIQNQQASQPPINSKFIRHIIGEKLKRETTDIQGQVNNSDEGKRVIIGNGRLDKERLDLSDESVSSS